MVHLLVSDGLKENICFIIIYGGHEIQNYQLPSKSGIETVDNYVQLVSNVSLSCIFYMSIPFDVGIIYLIDVNICTHLVSGGIHSTFLEILLWSATEQVTGN